MDLSFFFDAVDVADFSLPYGANPQSLARLTELHTGSFPQWQQADLVLLGVMEDRATVAGPRGSALAPNRIRDYLYRLALPHPHVRLADLGNLKYRVALDEVYTTLAYVLGVLLKAGKTVVLLGGANDLAYGQYLGYQELEQPIEYTAIDSRPDMLDAEVMLTHQSHNSQIFMQTPTHLAHFNCLGVQNYFVTEMERQALKAMHFETVRVNELHEDIRQGEPYLRQAHMVSVDLAVVRQADAPGTTQPSPAGLSAEEVCQLARFAGMGYNTSSFSITEVLPAKDSNGQTAHLAALIAWFFIEGFYNRVNDEPIADRSNLQTYRATLSGAVPEIVFYQHALTGRWWMLVPSPQVLQGKPGRTLLVPCTAAEHQAALRNEIPARWWLAHYRLS